VGNEVMYENYERELSNMSNEMIIGEDESAHKPSPLIVVYF
jgi:hypothetical protein